MVSENKEYNKALKELIKMGKKSGSLTESQVVEKTITLELTDEELDNLYNSIKEHGKRKYFNFYRCTTRFN